MRPIHLFIIILVVAFGTIAWVFLSPPSPPKATRPAQQGDFLDSTRDYDTTGGRQMKPRWGE
ncbi:hypothetical protein GCM10010869_05070 [Mesorhizobium tianshanense]|uniref:Ti type entry exclusion protein TrbK n=1 Tax=Mesorhizobium tianshanense TaxID=39844 RepID=A0A562NC97_9HYPH|nr:DUF2749 domain-containing protein [Mesorhizobium tianshanense]TWI29531.1 Ti type entry exclusion protein TrbK [Mesorhizobium tianshanense]GLS34919.1 hypothetical protein GCM10010869_05070 [Mesorhizobium tianshanense]